MQPFSEKIREIDAPPTRCGVDTLQVNLGACCNLACIHCHVESGPTRQEMMSRTPVDAVLAFLARTSIPSLDITGGAPELHPDFDDLVESARAMERRVIDRCNLTVVFEPGKDCLPEFFKRHQVELVCSLPRSEFPAVESVAYSHGMKQFPCSRHTGVDRAPLLSETA